ncbi:MAG: IS630 family transposase [Methyloprofundus sp.]|nr:IS630 family transposase [Methyloprofundus sp.]
MIYIKQLTTEEIITLNEMHKKHPLHLSRRRAHAVLLSYQGMSVPAICSIYTVCRQTVSTWFSKWNEFGICGLVDSSGRGRPPLLNDKQKSDVVKRVEKSPRSLKSVLSDLGEELGITVSIDTLKLLCKQAGLVWKRVRKSLRSKRNQDKFDAATAEINILIQQHKENEIDLCYFDESGFTLEPCVPYAWQPTGETIEIPSSKSKRLNVLGFVNRDCKFDSFVFEGSINTSVVVACIDEFSNQIKKPTTLIIDNAPTHTSNEFNENLERWKERDLTIYRIPTYSPELNIIEIVWRKIKYEWLPFSAYESYNSLKQELFNVLSNIGKTHKIAFS